MERNNPARILLIFLLVPTSHLQDNTGNANDFVDSTLDEMVTANAINDHLILKDQNIVLAFDLFLFRPTLKLALSNGRLYGLESLERSSDALVSYSEESGEPIFSITTSLSLRNISIQSEAQGQVTGLGFGTIIGLPPIFLDVEVDDVTVDTVIDVNIADLSAIKLGVGKVDVAEIGYIDVVVEGLTPDLDTFLSPISSLVVNTVKNDLVRVVQPLLKNNLEEVLKENAPTDISQILAG